MLFPDKVQQIRTSRAEARVPYLNMKKVRELMMRREEKFKKEMEAEGHHVNPTNKIIQLEGELDITRKELTSQMLKFRTMADDHKKMVLHIAELENRNSLLATSNATLSQNYHRVYNDYQLCKSVTNEVERVLGKQITQNVTQHFYNQPTPSTDPELDFAAVERSYHKRVIGAAR